MGYRFNDITLYHLTENSKNKNFSIRNHFISDLYIDFLEGYKPKGTTRISADIGKVDCIKGYDGSILCVEVAFNEKEYWISPPEDRNKIILDTLNRIAVMCAQKYGWDKGVFDCAYRKVLECGFVFKKELTRKLSKDRKHQASLLLEKNGNSAEITVNFYNSKGEFLKSVELFQSFDDAMFYGKLIEKSKWFNNREFGVYAKNGELVIKASLDKDGYETVVTPITNTLEEWEGYLRRITYQDFVNESDYIKWVNQ